MDDQNYWEKVNGAARQFSVVGRRGVVEPQEEELVHLVKQEDRYERNRQQNRQRARKNQCNAQCVQNVREPAPNEWVGRESVEGYEWVRSFAPAT